MHDKSIAVFIDMGDLTYLDIKSRGQKVEDLWIALSSLEAGYKSDVEVLSQREKMVYNKFDNHGRKKEFVGARSVLHNMARDAGVDVDTFQLKKTEQGRPYGITGSDSLQVSIAHTAKYVLCGLSRYHTIGVDLEPVDRTIHQRLRDRILTPAEKANSQLGTVETVRLWTIKEAVVKLTGEGLAGLLSEMAIDRVEDQLFTASLDGYRDITIYSWQYYDHWIAVAMY